MIENIRRAVTDTLLLWIHTVYKENAMSWSQWESEVLHILNNPDDENTRMVATAAQRLR
jgi:hypothetical protein